jgi:hypothetical protein
MNSTSRPKAALVLAVLFCVGFLLVLLSVLVTGYRTPSGIGENGTELLLATISLLGGLVGGFLARARVESHADDSRVGVILAWTLGMFVVFFGGALLIDALQSPLPGISGNTVNLLTVALGSSLGALGAYLGIDVSRYPPVVKEPKEESDEPKSLPSDEG